ncbi:hypothetical protein AAZX31_06G026300 [Glycine max]
MPNRELEERVTDSLCIVGFGPQLFASNLPLVLSAHAVLASFFKNQSFKLHLLCARAVHTLGVSIYRVQQRIEEAKSRERNGRILSGRENLKFSCQVCTYASQKGRKFVETQLRPQLAWSGWYPTGPCRPGQTQCMSICSTPSFCHIMQLLV